MTDEVWDGTPKGAMRVFLENDLAIAIQAAQHGLGVDPAQVAAAVLEQIDKIARESYPLHQVMAGSDLVVHAEGPGATERLPRLKALNWLSGTSERVLKSVASNWFDLHNADGRTLVKHLDLRLTGVAPGSLWLGFKLVAPRDDLLPSDEALFGALSDQFGMLPTAARFIGDEDVDPAIAEVLPDPAERDVLLDALRRMAPTGRAGIHTVEVGRGQEFASLSQRERIVLNEALRQPGTKNMRHGSFVGQVREADLDKTRIHLRGVEEIGALRCVLPEMSKEIAKALMGETVVAAGRYATDRAGRPRLLLIESIKPIKQEKLL